MTYQIGSEWRKWDLHIHTPASYLWNGAERDHTITSDEIKQVIESINSKDEIAVFAIQDYWTFDGYIKLRQMLDDPSNDLKTDKTIFPGMELRVDAPTDHRLNIHVLLSDDFNTEELQAFKSMLKINFADQPEPISRTTLIKLAKNFGSDKAQIHGTTDPSIASDDELFVLGAKTAVISKESLQTAVNHFNREHTRVLVLLPWDTYHGMENFSWQDHPAAHNFFVKIAHCFEAKHRKNIDFLAHIKTPENEHFIDNVMQSMGYIPKPSFRGSDAHNLSGYGVFPNEKITWVKSDPTFEGLIQVLYEPEDRVRVQPNNPTPSRSNYTLSNISLNKTKINEELTVDKLDIPLHYGLVAVTGGRGAGKTAFVDLIANCFEDRVNQKTDSNSFVKRISSDVPLLQTTLQFVDADEFTKGVKQDKFIIETEIAYISQGELDHYITENTRLTERIDDLIFSGIREVDKYEYEMLSQEIDDLEQQIIKTSLQIIELESKTTSKVTDNLNNQKARFEASLKDIERQILEISSNVAQHEVEEAQKAQDIVARLRGRQEKLEKLKQYLNIAKVFIDEDLKQFNDTIKSINEILADLEFNTTTFSEITYTENESLNQLLQSVEEAIKKNLAEIDEEQEKLDQQQNQVSEHAKLLDKRSQEEKALQNLVKSIQQVDQLKKALQETIDLRTSQYKTMLTLIKEKQSKYSQIIERFSEQLSSSATNVRTKVLTELDFYAEIQFAEDKFLESAEDLFNNRRITVRGKDSEFSNTLYLLREYTKQEGDNIDRLTNGIENHTKDNDLREKIKQNSSINQDDFFKVFYKNYFNVKPVVKYKETSLEHLSLGQKATVLMKIYLAQGRNPIIIDSHDDHLDNQFIMEELIPAIREAKKFRQIILVSNNANVVVNTDAEQIIIAERNDMKISFISGSLENSEIRKKALEVLEGGELAFKQRQQKYRLS